jgi:hypothetical protein
MSDEFAKGLAMLTGGLLGWMVLSGWYTTESFESPTQLIAEPPESLELFGTLALTLREAMFWFAIVGAIVFWVLIPASQRARTAWSERQSS